MSSVYVCQLVVNGESEGSSHIGVGSSEDVEPDIISTFWSWGCYPGVEAFYPVTSVNFPELLKLAGTTGKLSNTVVLDELERPTEDPLLTLAFNAQLNLDHETAAWKENGHHVFIWGHTTYLCILIRSIVELSVGVKCFSIQFNEETGYDLREENDIECILYSWEQINRSLWLQMMILNGLLVDRTHSTLRIIAVLFPIHVSWQLSLVPRKYLSFHYLKTKSRLTTIIHHRHGQLVLVPSATWTFL